MSRSILTQWFYFDFEPHRIYTRYLSEHIKNVIDSVIQRKAFFAHPENMLLAMLTDYRDSIQQVALHRILSVKTCSIIGGAPIRTFVVSKLNFDAKDHLKLIDY